MLGKYFECEADRNAKYYRVINTKKQYSDGKSFPIDDVVTSNTKINLNEEDRTKIGGFYISTYEYIFRWLIRGDTLCEVIIPEDSKIYKTTSDNGIYLSEKIILTNPLKLNDEIVMELYLHSTLSEKSYFSALAACAICGYINTALKVVEDRVNEFNVDNAIFELEEFCKRRIEEHNIDDIDSNECIKIIRNKLYELKNKNIL